MIEPLTTTQLDNILFNTSVTSKKYIGAYPSCFVPTSSKPFYSFISNTEEHNENGEHWCAWVVRDDTINFFDSFGRPPNCKTLPKHYEDITRNFKYIKYTNFRVQGWGSKACGYFCIHFIYVLSLGLDYKDFVNNYSKNFEMNDEKVNKLNIFILTELVLSFLNTFKRMILLLLD